MGLRRWDCALCGASCPVPGHRDVLCWVLGVGVFIARVRCSRLGVRCAALVVRCSVFGVRRPPFVIVFRMPYVERSSSAPRGQRCGWCAGGRIPRMRIAAVTPWCGGVPSRRSLFEGGGRREPSRGARVRTAASRTVADLCRTCRRGARSTRCRLPLCERGPTGSRDGGGGGGDTWDRGCRRRWCRGRPTR